MGRWGFVLILYLYVILYQGKGVDATGAAGRKKVRDYLHSKLKVGTRARYEQAWGAFTGWCWAADLDWEEAGEEDQDWGLAEAILDLYDEGLPVGRLGDLLSAVNRKYPGRILKASWKVFNAIRSDHPPQQAPPFPEEVLYAIVTILLLWGKEAVAGALLACFVATLRINEALSVSCEEVLRPTPTNPLRCIIFLLQVTKRGIEERVMITNEVVIEFFMRYAAWRGADADPAGRFFNVSYATVRLWMYRALVVLNIHHINFRTHSCRRGGATALLLRGIEIPSILIFCRWASVSTATDYLKKGELGVLRMRRELLGAAWNNVANVARLFQKAWDLRDNA